ncbi:MAG TPA: PAS domain-containing protein [Patescibacteria group bacterium]|nr:PAS domain-containing protein [Patescibacteria group bacterium]
MKAATASLTGVERHFDKDEVIVSKTNAKGILTYANRAFLRVSGFTEAEVIGKPHNILRHPAMPRSIFKLMWETIQAGREIFAYVINRSSNGDHYWVFAHVTPSFDAERRIVGFHSNRRVPERAVLDAQIIPLYAELVGLERRAADPRSGLESASQHLQDMLRTKGLGYDQFIFSL